MTERGKSALHNTADSFTVGPSHLHWDGTALTAEIQEVAVPLVRPMRGMIKLIPQSVTDYATLLDDKGRHGWWPIAPVSRVELSFTNPDLSWTGSGYFDSNNGLEPLEAAFTRWDWSRAHMGDGSSVMMFDPTSCDGNDSALAVRIDPTGRGEELDPLEAARLPRTGWMVDRRTRRDPGGALSVSKTLEDTPFYARSVVDAEIYGEKVTMMHESLDLNRFTSPIVQMMLPFRMPRRTSWP